MSKNWQTKYRRQTAASNKVRDGKNEMGPSKESGELKRKRTIQARIYTTDLTKTERENRKKMVAELKAKRLLKPSTKYKTKGNQIVENRIVTNNLFMERGRC